MAKRSTNRKQATKETVEIQRPLVQIEHRGMYWYAGDIVGYEPCTVSKAEVEQLSKPPDIDKELSAAVTAARNVAAKKIRPHLTPIESDDLPEVEDDRDLVWGESGQYELRENGKALYKGGYVDSTAILAVGGQFITFIDVGDGPRWYALDRKPPDDVAIALAALRAIEHMKAGGTSATFHALRLGRLLERLIVMPHEPDILHEKNRKAKIAGPAKKRRDNFRELYQILRADDPHEHKTTIIQRVIDSMIGKKRPSFSAAEKYVRDLG